MLKFGCKESFDAWVDLIALVLDFADTRFKRYYTVMIMIKGETSVETLFFLERKSCGYAESFSVKNVSVISCDVIVGAINRLFTFV